MARKRASFRRRYRRRKNQWKKNIVVRTDNFGYPSLMGRTYNSQIYRFRRSKWDQFSLTYNAASNESHGVWKFTLADLTNYNEFTNLFDKYRITGIKARFFPRMNVNAHSDVSATWTEIPPIMTVIDYDDATAGDYTVLQQYENVKIHNEFKPFSLYFKPLMAVATYGGAAFTSYGSGPKNMWIDCNSAGVEYYALKWATPIYSLGNNDTHPPAWDVMFTYYIDFKYPR